MAGVVFPKCLILVGESIAGILPDAGLDAIRNLTVIGADAMHRCVFAVEKPPTAHQRRGRVAPRRRRVVAVTVAWEIHHVSVYRRCGKHRCADRQKRHHAHEQGQECRKGFLERFTFHRSFTSCFFAAKKRTVSDALLAAWCGLAQAQPIYRSYRPSALGSAQTQKYMMPSAAFSSGHDLISRSG